MDKPTVYLNVVVGVVCAVIGSLGLLLMAYIVERSGSLLKLLTDPFFVGLGLLAAVFFLFGVKAIRTGGRSQRPGGVDPQEALPPAHAADQPWLRRKDWRKREIVHGRTVGCAVMTLAFLVVGGPILLILPVAIENPRNATSGGIFAMIAMGAMVAAFFGVLVYWWLRHRRYGDSVCRLLTLPGVIGDWFKADVECTLPPDPGEQVIVRLKNLVHAGRRLSERWRMEERLSVPVLAGARSVVRVRLRVPRHPAQVPLSLRPSFWTGDGAVWHLELEKKTAGVDFFASFPVPIYDTLNAPPSEQPKESSNDDRQGAFTNKSLKFPLIGLGGTAVIEVLAAAVVQFRLLPFLQGDIVRFGRAGNPIPTDQFVALAVPILVGLALFSVACARLLVISRGKKAD